MSFMDHELHPPQSPVEELEERIEELKRQRKDPDLPQIQGDMMLARIQAYEDAVDVFQRSQWQ